MEITFDEAKRIKTFQERGLDFRDAPKVFAEVWLVIPDDRFEYGEDRFISYGELEGRAIAMVWTWRGKARRIISMRHVHAKELENRRRALD